MKKALAIVGGLIGLIIVALLVIPLVVNVDKFRPQIVKAANDKMNGSLELGKLSLSLWGRIHVSVDGMKIMDAQKNEIVSVKDASFDSSYGSIFSGSPLVTISMKEPAITVLKGKDGKLNVMTLMKEAAPGSTPAPGATTTTTTTSTGSAEVPSIVVNSHIGISIQDATLIYMDQVLALSNTIDKLNVRVKDFSLSRKTEIEVWADLKTTMGTDLKVEGPLKFNASLLPEIVSGEFKSGTVSANFSADDLTIEKGQLFQKKKGIPANFKFDATLSQTSMKLTQATLNFHNAQVLVNGTYGKDAGADIHFETKPVDLKPWSELGPMLKEYELEGKLNLAGNVKGKPEALNYDAKLGIENLSAKGPNLKAKPIINGSVSVVTDKIERFLVDLKGPGNEMVLDGKLVSFSKPTITFSLNSPKGMDLDQWIEFPKPATTAKGKEDAGKGAAAGEKVPAADLDAMVDPLRKNEMVRNTTVDGTVSIAFLKAMNVKIENIGMKVQFKNLVAAMTGIKMKIYDGVVAGSFSTDLKPAKPAYNMNLSLAGLDLAKAVESQFEAFKNTILGKLSFTAQGGGSSFNTEAAKKNLQMKGDFKVLNAQFKTIDVSKMANEAMNGSVGKIADKVPFLKGKNLHVNEAGASEYESVTSHFTINNGVLDAPDFFAKAAPKRGIDLKGSTKMGLIDQSLDAKWELIDTQHVTGADQLTVNVAGKDIHNFLAKSEKDPVIIPVTVGCKWSAPCPGYGAAPEYLAGVAASRLSGVAKDVAVDKAKSAIKNALPGGLKNLFGN
jgi:uncharacterized protein involved in outer membrane biogenesis